MGPFLRVLDIAGDLSSDMMSDPDGVLARLWRCMMQDDAPAVWRQLEHLRHPVGVRAILSVRPDGEYDGSGRGEQVRPERRDMWW